jgi:hypothetical protein
MYFKVQAEEKRQLAEKNKKIVENCMFWIRHIVSLKMLCRLAQDLKVARDLKIKEFVRHFKMKRI